MLDIFNFIVLQFGNFINFLDSFYLIENLSLLRILIIIFLFYVSLNFLIRKGSDNK